MKAIVLGGSGMLGSMVVDYLAREPAFSLVATVRTQTLAAELRRRIPGVTWHLFDAADPDSANTLPVETGDWIINAIGIIKPLVHDDNVAEVERAVRINSLLPYQLARLAGARGAKVIQIATDCVYSGRKGGYVESDAHDPEDAYGRTKSLGEVKAPFFYHLRCSIIGPEMKEHLSLLDWFLGQPPKGGVNGFVNHRWNGITTLHFARICGGIIGRGLALKPVQHIIPSGILTKYELLQSFGRYFHREDVSITPVDAPAAIDRTLETADKALNQAIWWAAGYPRPPDIPEMVAELAGFDYRLKAGL